MLNFNSKALLRECNRVAVGEGNSSPQHPLSICSAKEGKLTVQEREHLKEIMNKRLQRNSLRMNTSIAVEHVSAKNNNNNLNRNLSLSNQYNQKHDSYKTNTSTTDSFCE